MKSKLPHLPEVVSACPDCGKYPTLRKVADPFGEEDFYWSYGCDCTMAVDTNKKAVYEYYGHPNVVRQ
jgi:hypothetical protein